MNCNDFGDSFIFQLQLSSGQNLTLSNTLWPNKPSKLMTFPPTLEQLRAHRCPYLMSYLKSLACGSKPDHPEGAHADTGSPPHRKAWALHYQVPLLSCLSFIRRGVLTILFSSCFYRKDQHLLSSVNCWYLVLNQTRRESRDHATLSDIYTNNVIVRLAQISEDVIRLFKKVSETIILSSFFTAILLSPAHKSLGKMQIPSN